MILLSPTGSNPLGKLSCLLKGGRPAMSNLTTTMEMEKCPVCGADVRSRDKFCWNCGRSLRNASPSPQPEQTLSWSSARLVVTTSAREVLQESLLEDFPCGSRHDQASGAP